MKIELLDNTGYFILLAGKKFLIDFKQYEKLHNDGHIWHYDGNTIYPYYNKTKKMKENLIEYFYTNLYDTNYINNDIYDIRKANCKLVVRQSLHDSYVRKNYNVIDYIQGHYRANSQTSIYNMTWIILEENKEDLINSEAYYLMYCEKDTLVKLTKDEYEKLMEYNKSINYKLTWFHHIRKDNNNKYIIAKFNNNIIHLHQIIPSFNKKTKVIYIGQPLIKETTFIKINCFDKFDKLDKEIREKYNVTDMIKGHVKNSGIKANTERNRIWILDTHYLMICEKDTLVKLCSSSYQKILEYEKQNDCKITWYLQKNGYIAGHVTEIKNCISDTITSDKVIYMHQVIMNCYGNGKGTKNISVDHIDQDPTNNMMENLRIATREEQEQNSKGIKVGTKRARKHNAKLLPEGLTQNMMKKYIVYYNECYNKEKKLYREFFKIEQHPKLDKIWTSSKSNKISITEKLAAATKVVEDLENDVYPEITNILPLYITLKIEKNKQNLIFDKRDNNKRYNLRMALPLDYNMVEQLGIFKDKIKEKYDIII